MEFWLNWLSSTAFQKDSFSCVKNERNTLRIQSQIDRLRLVFHLIQVRNGTFFPASDPVFFVCMTITWHDGNKSVFISIWRNFLPVTEVWILRANLKNRCFVRLCVLIKLMHRNLSATDAAFFAKADEAVNLHLETARWLKFNWMKSK